MAVVETSWICVLGGMIFLLALITTIIRQFSKIYYFGSNKITIADHKNIYIDDIPLNQIYCWNEYKEYKDKSWRHCIVIQAVGTSIIIEKGEYKNYYDILAYFYGKNLKQDKTLKAKSINNEIYSPIEKSLLIYLQCLILFSIFSFYIIFSLKDESSETLYFTGTIERIYHPSKHQYIEISLKNISFHFKVTGSKAISFFTAYNYDYGKNTPVNMGKKIKITVSKDDYDWKIKNKIVSRLNINSVHSLDVKEYKILE